VTREWVTVHRKHHAACETPVDPHSPQTRGIAAVLLRGSELYAAAAKDRRMLEQYGAGTPDDWLERKLYTPHSFHGVGLAEDGRGKRQRDAPRVRGDAALGARVSCRELRKPDRDRSRRISSALRFHNLHCLDGPFSASLVAWCEAHALK
jgi:hypothetical protein